MTRGHLPKAAIAEAKRQAAKKGYQVFDVDPSSHPFDFMISRDSRVTIVRVRRFRYAVYDADSVASRCREEVEALRTCSVSGTRELWVRGPDQSWHRYRVKDEGLRRLSRWEVFTDDPAGG